MSDRSPRKKHSLNEALKPELCIICHYDFDSHRWLRPAIAARAGLPHGHDFTPLKGESIPHPYWTPAGEGYARYVRGSEPQREISPDGPC